MKTQRTEDVMTKIRLVSSGSFLIAIFMMAGADAQNTAPGQTQAGPPVLAKEGPNLRKASGFCATKPPAGQTHPYHFEVFALDTKLRLDPATTDRNAVVAAMKDHVLAGGDIVANYTGE